MTLNLLNHQGENKNEHLINSRNHFSFHNGNKEVKQEVIITVIISGVFSVKYSDDYFLFGL